MWKKVLCLLAVPGILFTITSAGSASEQTLFGPEDCRVGWVRMHISFHKFKAYDLGKAVIIISKNTPEKQIRGGFVRFNNKFIPLSHFFKSEDLSLEIDVDLRVLNHLLLFFRGTRGASIQVEVRKKIVTPPPEVTFTANPQAIKLGETSTLTWTTSNANSVNIEPTIGGVDPNNSHGVSPSETTTYTLTAVGDGGTTTKSLTVTVYQPPSVTIGVDPETIFYGESSTLTWTCTNAAFVVIDPQIGLEEIPLEGSHAVTATHSLTYTITATGPGGTASSAVVLTVTANVEPQPEGSFGEQYEDLIPPDATISTYASNRFSLITGLVRNLDDLPIADVSVTVHGHSEYGTAYTDGEGRFSISVEGGATNTVIYQKEGLIGVQRKVHVPWNDIAVAETIKMISEDPASTIISFDGSPQTVVTHQSTAVTDDFGTRSCTMVFRGDNSAYEVDAQGNVIRKLNSITTRATEYTTPESMPAKLPPNSAYTYCAELEVDGVERVKFAKPVITWVDNFLGFDVGTAVPVGYYDRDRGVWVPSENGVVVELLDTDGPEGIPDGIVDAFEADGIEGADGIVEGLDDPARYPPGSTFWRIEISHFSPWDFNWPFGPPPDAIDPNPVGAPNIDQENTGPKVCKRPISSFIDERSRIFHEDIPIHGTDMSLHYTSSRVAGYKTIITVPVSGETVPNSLKRIIARVEVAGRRLEQILGPLPNQMAEFVWDGLDHLGRPVAGTLTAHISVGFVYDGFYYSPSNSAPSFGQAGIAISPIQARRDTIAWLRNEIPIHLAQRGGVIAEGWTLSTHHSVDPGDLSTLHKGDGTVIKNNASIITTVVGDGTQGYSGDGGPATQAQIHGGALTFDAAGNLYIADYANHAIRKVDVNGTITTVAGGNGGGFSGDGGPATEAQLYYPIDMALDAVGNLYIADFYNHRIRKVDPNGIISTVAGSGCAGSPNCNGYSGDGGPATQAQFRLPRQIAVDASGNLYIADDGNRRIRKVDTSGNISTVAGNGTSGYLTTNGIPAIEAPLGAPEFMVADNTGNLYVNDHNRILKVDATGIITTVAGVISSGYSGDGGPANEAQLDAPQGMALDAAGNLYVAEYFNNRIRKIDTNGTISTVAGSGCTGLYYCYPVSSGDGGPALAAVLDRPSEVAIDPLGNLYVYEGGGVYRIRKIAPPITFSNVMTSGDVAFAEANGQGHIMTSSGRHKFTIDLNTGIKLREFSYDQDNLLVSINDHFGNQTTIERDGEGVATAIISPDGIKTGLSINGSNQLTDIFYPNGSYYSFAYTPSGLMTAKVQPEGNRFEHFFDSTTGRLTDATDQEGGNWRYSRTAFETGEILIEVTTGEGNVTSYLDLTDSTGSYTSTITDPTGAETVFSQSADGLKANKSLPCGMELELKFDVDPEYKFKYLKEVRESTPANLKKVTHKEISYQDNDADDVPDVITEMVTVNGKATTLVTDTPQATKIITSPAGRTVTTNYDRSNLLTTRLSIPGLHETVYGYDTRGRLTSVATDLRETTFSYDDQGNLKSITDPENHTTTYSYDSVGRMTAISRPDTSSVAFTYDKNGNMTVLTNPVTINHFFGYNKVNLNSSYLTPLSGSYSYEYDRDRKLTQVNFPSGKQINNIYGNGNLEQIRTPEGNIHLTYACANKVDTITKGSEEIAYGYDGSLVTSENLSGTLNESLSYAYNHDFNLQSFSYAGGAVTYEYDNDGLLTNAGDFTIGRNSGNGLPEAVTGGTFGLSRTFDGYGEVEGQDFTIGGQGVTSWTLTRDNAGRIITKSETIAGQTSNYSYTYDPLGRLLTATKDSVLVESYEYDDVGTRKSDVNVTRGISGRTFTYDSDDHLLIAGDAVYQYDADGYLTMKTVPTADPDADEVTLYNYSSLGALLNVTLPDGRVVAYVHDPLGRRIAKSVDGVITEKYLWQGLTRLLAVYDGIGNLTMRFLYADGRVPVAMEQGGAIYYFTYDQVGSLRVVADSSGNLVKRIDYDSFGNIINDTNPLFEIPFGFAGGLHDQETNLVRFGLRDYDSDTGRWTAKDPILFAGGDVDLYGYVLNDPVNFVDPSGLVNWYRVVFGVGLGLKAVFTAGVGVAAIVGTASVTGNPVLTGVIAVEMIPVFAVAVMEAIHAFEQIQEGLKDAEPPRP